MRSAHTPQYSFFLHDCSTPSVSASRDKHVRARAHVWHRLKRWSGVVVQFNKGNSCCTLAAVKSTQWTPIKPYGYWHWLCADSTGFRRPLGHDEGEARQEPWGLLQNCPLVHKRSFGPLNALIIDSLWRTKKFRRETSREMAYFPWQTRNPCKKEGPATHNS